MRRLSGARPALDGGSFVVVTSEDVARAAGVSRSTVSQILNGKGQLFAEATRAKVLQTASDLNYEPSAAARTLAIGSSDLVVALIPNTTFGGNLQDLFENATEEFAARGLTLVLRLATDDAAALGRMLAGMKPRAVMSLVPFTTAERQVLDASAVLSFDASPEDVLAYDNYVGRVQAEHLHRRGHRRLAFAHLRDARQDPYGGGREQGVRQYCADNGLHEPEVVHLGINLDEATAALDSLKAPSVAIACYNDDVATALLAAARRRDLRVPEDVALIGMDHTPLSQVTVPPLTTLAYDVTAAGRTAMSVVLAGLTGEAPADRTPDLRLHVVPGGTA